MMTRDKTTLILDQTTVRFIFQITWLWSEIIFLMILPIPVMQLCHRWQN